MLPLVFFCSTEGLLVSLQLFPLSGCQVFKEYWFPICSQKQARQMLTSPLGNSPEIQIAKCWLQSLTLRSISLVPSPDLIKLSWPLTTSSQAVWFLSMLPILCLVFSSPHESKLCGFSLSGPSPVKQSGLLGSQPFEELVCWPQASHPQLPHFPQPQGELCLHWEWQSQIK